MLPSRAFPLLLLVPLLIVTVTSSPRNESTRSQSQSTATATLAPPQGRGTRTATPTLTPLPPSNVDREVALLLTISPPDLDVYIYHNTPFRTGGYFANRTTGESVGGLPASVNVTVRIVERVYSVDTQRRRTGLISSFSRPARGIVVALFATNNESYWFGPFSSGLDEAADKVNRNFPQLIRGTQLLDDAVRRTSLEGVATFTSFVATTCMQQFSILAVPETDSLLSLLGITIDVIEIAPLAPRIVVTPQQDVCTPFVSAVDVRDLLFEPMFNASGGPRSITGYRLRNTTNTNAHATAAFGDKLPPVLAVMKDSCGGSMSGVVVVRSRALVSDAVAADLGQTNPTHRVASGLTSLNIDGSGAVAGMRMVLTEPVAPTQQLFVDPSGAILVDVPRHDLATFDDLLITINMTNIDPVSAALIFSFYPATPATPLQQMSVDGLTFAPSTPAPTLDPSDGPSAAPTGSPPLPSATPTPTAPRQPRWPPLLTRGQPCGTVQLPVRVTARPNRNQRVHHVDLRVEVEPMTAEQLSTKGATIRIWANVDAFHPFLGGANTMPRYNLLSPAAAAAVNDLFAQQRAADTTEATGTTAGDAGPAPTPDPLDPAVRNAARQRALYVSQAVIPQFLSFSSSISRRRAPRGFLYNVEEEANILIYKRRRLDTNAAETGVEAGREQRLMVNGFVQLWSVRQQDLRTADVAFPVPAAVTSGGASGHVLINDTARPRLNTTLQYYIELTLTPSPNYFTNLRETINMTILPDALVPPFYTNTTHIIFDVAPFPIAPETTGRRWFGLVAMFGDHVNLGTLAIIRHAGSCAVDEGAQLDFVLHPITIGITDDPQRFFIGAVICNSCIAIGFTLLYFALSRIVFKGDSNFPHLALRVSYILYPGTTLGALSCFFARDLHPGLFYFILAVSTMIVVVYPMLYFFLSRKARAKWVSVLVDMSVENRDRHLDPLLTKKERKLLAEHERVERLKREAREAARLRQKSLGPDGTQTTDPAQAADQRIALSSRLAKFLISDGRYMYLHRDHLKFRATYQYFRGPTSYFGTIELLYSLVCALAIFASCPLNTVLIITTVSLHLAMLFILHPYFSVGRNLFALCVDIMFLTGSVTYLRGQEASARTIFDSAELFGSTMNLLGMIWSAWVSLRWRSVVRACENFGKRVRVKVIERAFAALGAHLDELSSIDPDAEFELYQRKQAEREAADRQRRTQRRATMKQEAAAAAQQALAEERELMEALGIAVPTATATTKDASPLPAADGGTLSAPLLGDPGDLRSDDNKDDPFARDTGGESSCDGHSSDGGSSQELIDEIITAHRKSVEQRRRVAWERALADHRRRRGGGVGDAADQRSGSPLGAGGLGPTFAEWAAQADDAAAADAHFVVGIDADALDRRERSAHLTRGRSIFNERRSSSPGHGSDAASGDDDLTMMSPEQRAAAAAAALEQARKLDEISWYMREQQQMADAYHLAKARADRIEVLRENYEKNRKARHKRRLGVSDAQTIVTRIYVTETGVHEVRKPRPKVYKEEKTAKAARKAVERERLLALGIEVADSDSDDERKKHRAGSSDSDDDSGVKTRPVFEKAGSVRLASKRNVIIERMRAQGVKPIQESSYMYDML